LINTFSDSAIKYHVMTLSKHCNPNFSPQQLKTKALPIIRKLLDHKYSYIFNAPVDPVALELHDYFKIITEPMDLGTVKKRLESGQYKQLTKFNEEVLLTFDNAMKYNADKSPVHVIAKEMRKMFEDDFKKVTKAVELEEEKRRAGENACRLCGGERFLFEPQVFYCNGHCNGRIRRNSYYWSNNENKYHWCHQCFGEIKETHMDVGGTQVDKKTLTKKKNDDVNEEGWVQCETCTRWVHQICALFNGRNNQAETKYHCPACILVKRQAKDVKFAQQKACAGAEDLPRTKLSDYMENDLKKLVEEWKAGQVGASGNDQDTAVIGSQNLDLSVRCVSCVKKDVVVRERMLDRYKEHSYPQQFDYRSKCITLWQTMNGVDSLVFGMYVHEYADDCPQPNNRRVYISYLDSVKYLNPPHLRTPIYHQLIISYCAWVKQLGFHTCHIWACPPVKGDDYILYCKPEDQKTPRAERLRGWYITLLEVSKEQGTVHSLTNFYDEFFTR
jgi:E1A/CREB-binding protein